MAKLIDEDGLLPNSYMPLDEENWKLIEDHSEAKYDSFLFNICGYEAIIKADDEYLESDLMIFSEGCSPGGWGAWSDIYESKRPLYIGLSSDTELELKNGLIFHSQLLREKIYSLHLEDILKFYKERNRLVLKQSDVVLLTKREAISLRAGTFSITSSLAVYMGQAINGEYCFWAPDFHDKFVTMKNICGNRYEPFFDIYFFDKEIAKTFSLKTTSQKEKIETLLGIPKFGRLAYNHVYSSDWDLDSSLSLHSINTGCNSLNLTTSHPDPEPTTPPTEGFEPIKKRGKGEVATKKSKQ